MSIYSIAIGFYRRFLSPYKGFRCAYAAYHHGPSCSMVIESILNTHGVRRGLPLIRQQFRQCRTAFIAYSQQNAQQNEEGGQSGTAPGDSIAPNLPMQRRMANANQSLARCCSRSSHTASHSSWGDCAAKIELCDIVDPCAWFDVSACELGVCEIGACDSGGAGMDSCEIGSCDGD